MSCLSQQLHLPRQPQRQEASLLVLMSKRTVSKCSNGLPSMASRANGFALQRELLTRELLTREHSRRPSRAASPRTYDSAQRNRQVVLCGLRGARFFTQRRMNVCERCVNVELFGRLVLYGPSSISRECSLVGGRAHARHRWDSAHFSRSLGASVRPVGSRAETRAAIHRSAQINHIC